VLLVKDVLLSASVTLVIVHDSVVGVVVVAGFEVGVGVGVAVAAGVGVEVIVGEGDGAEVADWISKKYKPPAAAATINKIIKIKDAVCFFKLTHYRKQ
jgi:hypothetical protein